MVTMAELPKFLAGMTRAQARTHWPALLIEALAMKDLNGYADWSMADLAVVLIMIKEQLTS